MSEIKYTDCLVLKLEEINVINNNKIIDNSVYIIYDTSIKKYIIRGKRNGTKKHKECNFSFECINPIHLVEFLKYIFCRFSTINESLYNYDNLPQTSNEITYEFLKNNEHFDYEISGYDEVELETKSLLKKLKMLKNINNLF
jgi:hypothetical protein